MFKSYDDFRADFDIQPIDFEEFCGNLSILDISDTTGTFSVRSDIDTFIERVSKKDDRKERLAEYKRMMYDRLVANAESTLRAFYDKYIALKMDVSEYINMPAGGCLDGDVFNGASNAKYGRTAKSMNFDDFYNTKKLYGNDSEYVYGLLKVMFEKHHIRNSMASPAFFDILATNDISKFWNFFMMGANKASVFNPYTYRHILDTLFEGDVIFAPVMGWNMYQQAFYTSKFKKFVSTDVIPGVVDNCERLHELYLNNMNPFDVAMGDVKEIDCYLCPSEKLNERYGFINKYRNSVDAVLFSPPYFDLEVYPGEEQSIESFPDYEAWLEGYWRETVKLCREVMKDGAKFGFVIRNYRNKQKVDVDISGDMMRVASEELSFVKRYYVKWSTQAGSRQAHKMRGGNYEDVWLFQK